MSKGLKTIANEEQEGKFGYVFAVSGPGKYFIPAYYSGCSRDYASTAVMARSWLWPPAGHPLTICWLAGTICANRIVGTDERYDVTLCPRSFALAFSAAV